ncbi:hypothetical protein IM793_23970 [Pedobacter sp. MR2016-19]|uniref:putative nucleotide-diphospho-sugar transferase n=1 Tax=Pedobacter sp. MR2016-19 TaxID=2780089 RepID=UPI0018766A90|nr:putative nucleotide-diphospho-sugar transferase [Pedobacter sp. MR2016-19]MBE5322232.1 hypothetical protein [Pedobacter sp. MR2016-19]
MSKITKIYSFYTDEVVELKSIFQNSIKDDWEVHIEYLGKTGEGNGNFATKGWYQIIQTKISFLIEKIKENRGDIIIWADIDIQFYGMCSELIYSAIAGNDIVFQAERWPLKEVNSGFTAIRCNDLTLLLYELILQSDFGEMPFADQSAMNQILRENKIAIKWNVLPRQFWATSHYMFDSLMPPNDIVLHHANCTAPILRDGMMIGSIQLKLEQFKIINHYLSSRQD